MLRCCGAALRKYVLVNSVCVIDPSVFGMKHFHFHSSYRIVNTFMAKFSVVENTVSCQEILG